MFGCSFSKFSFLTFPDAETESCKNRRHVQCWRFAYRWWRHEKDRTHFPWICAICKSSQPPSLRAWAAWTTRRTVSPWPQTKIQKKPWLSFSVRLRSSPAPRAMFTACRKNTRNVNQLAFTAAFSANCLSTGKLTVVSSYLNDCMHINNV